MLKKVISIIAAIILLTALLPNTYGGDPGTVFIGVKDSERYYHRLKNMRRNEPDNPESVRLHREKYFTGYKPGAA